MIQNYSNEISLHESKAIELFSELGMQKNIAKTLLCISINGGCRSVDIEQKTKQRQQEVSVATQELMKKGWITKLTFIKKRKVKPVQIYRLTCSINEIINKIEKEKTKEIEKIIKNLSTIKTLIKSYNYKIILGRRGGE